MAFNYYYGNQADQFSFVRIPKLMLKDKQFADLSLAAKMLDGWMMRTEFISFIRLQRSRRTWAILKRRQLSSWESWKHLD